MSVHVSSLVWQASVGSHTRKIVLLKLADHAHDDGTHVRPGQERISRECECEVRTVQRVIAWAVKEGILKTIPTPGNRPNEYAFSISVLKSLGRQKVTLTQSHPDLESPRQKVVLTPTESHPWVTESHPINKNHQLTVSETSRGKRPSEDEFLAYALTQGFPPQPAKEAFNHYELVGWVQGKSHHPIKDWKRAVITSRDNWRKWRSQDNGGRPAMPHARDAVVS